jgi:biotin synthase
MSVSCHDWSLAEVQALYALPFNDLIFQAQTIHRENFDPNQIQVSSLLSIKTGSCSEDCGYLYFKSYFLSLLARYFHHENYVTS